MVTMIFFFLSLLFTALALGPAFSHVLEMPGKRRLSPMVWLAVQQTLFTSFGRALGIIESAAFLATLVLAFLQGHNPVIAALIAFAALCVAAMPLICGLLTTPSIIGSLI